MTIERRGQGRPVEYLDRTTVAVKYIYGAVLVATMQSYWIVLMPANSSV